METKFEYASFFSRFLAWIIDMILLSFIYGVVFSTSGIGLSDLGTDNFSTIVFSSSFGFSSFLGFLYFVLFESSELQATPGKRLMGLKVIDYDGGRITFFRALIRKLGKIVSQAILMIGYLMAAITDKNQALHDYIASTYVVQR